MKLTRRCIALAAFAAVILQAGVALAATVPTVAEKSALAVSFSDSQHGYISGGYTGDDGVLAYTSDGGVHWAPSQRPTRRLWAVAASLDGSSATASADGYDEVLGFSSSGATWGLPQAPGFGDNEPHVTDVAYLSGRTVAVGQKVIGYTNYSDVSHVAVIADKPNGGAWGDAFIGPLVAPNSDGSPNTTLASLSSIDATANGNIAWTVGAEFTAQQFSVKRSLVYRTLDGGSSWTTDTASAALTYQFNAVSAVGADTAFATTRSNDLGDKAPLRRINGAWEAMPAPSATFKANAIDAFDADHLVVVGDGGQVYYSSNASSSTPTWTARPTTGATNALRGVQMLGAESWIVVGDNETIVRYTNGGATQEGSYGLAAPSVAINTPTTGFALSPGTLTVSGTSGDAGIGVLGVDVMVRRNDGRYWNGVAWGAEAKWNQASGTTDAWNYYLDPGILAPQSVTITARATDGMNQVGQISVSSATPPPPPPAAVIVNTSTRISGSSSVRVKKTLKLSGTVSPSAARGTVTITMTRKVGRKWRSAGHAHVAVSGGSYRYSFKPKYRGSWRLVSSYAGGTVGTTTYNPSRSSTKSLRVK
jgi:hypothetical protein